LNALASLSIAVWLAATLPPSQGSGLVALVGWVGVVLLGFGLLVGYRGAVAGVAVAFVVRSALMTPFEIELFPPLWAQTLLIVLVIELAAASFVLRSRPADPLLLVTRALSVAVLAAGLTQILAMLVEGAVVTGLLVKVAGVAAVVIAAGWVTRVWQRSGLSG
jgi:hypothetical protein